MASGAVAQNRLAPLAAAFGLVLAFVSVGVFLQTVGFALGITADGVQKAGGVVLLLAAAVLLIEPLQFFLQRFLSPLSGRAGNAVHQQSGRSLLSWIVIGFLLGAVWSPCTGPALASAFAISSQQDTMLLGMALLAVFGIGTATPLLILAYGSRGLAARFHKMGSGFGGKKIKTIFGLLLLLIGVLMVTDGYTAVQVYLTDRLPSAWLQLVTRY
jgi:cytochrome c biogenesis protein CcdA